MKPVRMVVLTLLALTCVPMLAFVSAHDTAAVDALPPAKALGAGWSLLDTIPPSDDLDPSFRDAASGVYGGPNGARVAISVFLVAEGMTAIRNSWRVGGEVFDSYERNIDYEYNAERNLANWPLPNGCAEARRTTGTENLGFEAFPVGLTLCAADPDMILMVYASGEVAGATGVDASDAITELVLADSRATPTARPREGQATPVVDVGSRPARTPTSSVPMKPAARLTTRAMAQETVASGEGTTGQQVALAELLPTEDEVPQGLTMTKDATRTEDEVVQGLGTEDATQLLDSWGWAGNSYRRFSGTDMPAGSTTFLDVSLHRFASADAAAEALTYFSDQVIAAQGLEEDAVDPVGDAVRALTGVSADGATNVVVYVRQGADLIRVGGTSADGNPMDDVLNVAKTVAAKE